MGFFSKLFTDVSSWSDTDLQQELTSNAYEYKKAQAALNFNDLASIERWKAKTSQIELKRNQIIAEIKKRGISEYYTDPRVTELIKEYEKNKK